MKTHYKLNIRFVKAPPLCFLNNCKIIFVNFFFFYFILFLFIFFYYYLNCFCVTVLTLPGQSLVKLPHQESQDDLPASAFDG